MTKRFFLQKRQRRLQIFPDLEGSHQAEQRWGSELKNVTERVCNAQRVSFVVVVEFWPRRVVQYTSREASCRAADVYIRAICSRYAAISGRNGESIDFTLKGPVAQLLHEPLLCRI